MNIYKFALKSLLVPSIALPTFAQSERLPHVPAEHLQVPEGLEVKVWATSPMFYNPTNMAVDAKGRIWVNEGRAYRAFRNKSHAPHAKTGDRIMVLSDTDQDGVADSEHVFVQDPELIAPLGIAVIDNKVVVSQPPHIIIYHDLDRDAKFNPEVDTKENFLSGFGGKDHDHSLHAVTTGPSGQWYFNAGNAGTHVVQDKEGFTIRAGSSYRSGAPSVSKKGPNQGGQTGLKSDDGHFYVGGVALRVNPDGTGLRVIGHNMRNSYEETVTSYGDVFQNDNDDPPACRNTWLMEYGNLGFSSDDGKTTWLSDRRPGQQMSDAHWRQDDPGKIPAGDIYGNGSPTGIAFNENGALGEQWNGLLLSGEAARNVIFGYHPKPQGAGFSLERFDFLSIKSEEETKGAKVSPNNFRPSDVLVGTDGAIYVADWFDAGVGGHIAKDSDYAGAIYRITKKGQNPTAPTYNLETTEGQIEALKSPASNVRNVGFTRLLAQGESAIPAVKDLLSEESDYIKARALWLLPQMGEAGIKLVEEFMASSTDDQLRITCFRSLRFIDHQVLENAKALASDQSIAVRREVALALRDKSWAEAGEIITELASHYDGQDRWNLEAIGTAASGKENELYTALLKANPQAPTEWSTAMARLAWRLHPDQAVDAFKQRALSDAVSGDLRKEMLTAIGYIKTKEAAVAMVEIAENGNADLKETARWWLYSRSKGYWAKYEGQMKGLNEKLNALPSDVDYLVGLDRPEITKPTVEEVLTLTGDAEKGKIMSAICYQCHKINDIGIEFGPTLTEWGIGRDAQTIAEAIIQPNAGVAHGFDGTEIKMKSGNTIQGISLSGGGKAKRLVVKVFGGGEVELDTKQVKKRKELESSLMLSAGQMGLTSQNVADIAAYLRALGKEVNAK